MKQKLLKLMCLLCVSMIGVSAWAETETLSVDFENQVGTYSDWTITNFSQSSTDITAHGGSCFGTNGSKTTASVQTKNKIANPVSLTCYYSKTSTNTNNTSLFKIQVSSNGSTWTDVASGKTMNNVTKGTWEVLTGDLSSYEDVYVRVYYTGTNASRALDDVVLTYTTSGEDIPSISGYDVDFESLISYYSDWSFTSINTNDNSISAHGGSKYGVTAGTATASITTTTKVSNPNTFTCYVSKTSNNTTSSTWYVEVSTDLSNWTQVASQSATSMNKGTWTEITADLQEYSDVYVRLRYNGSTAVRAVDDISITEGGKKKATVSIAATQLVIGGTATVTTNGPAVTLTTSAESIASVSGNTVTAEGVGTATITATWSEDENYQAGSKEFTVTVKRVDGLSEANAFTVAEARAMIDEGADAGATYFVKGIITKIDSYNSTYSSITYWISDDGITTNQFEIYGGLGYNGNSTTGKKAFTGTDNLQLGNTVVVKGELAKFGATYELNKNNELVSMTYNRATTAGKWGTICLPYNAIVEGAKIYSLAGKETKDGLLTSLVFDEETSIEAGVPYAFKATGTELKATYTNSDYEDASDWYGFYGTYEGVDAGDFTVNAGNLYLMTADKVVNANPANSSVGANRAYFDMANVTEYDPSSPVKGIRLGFDGTETPTGITELTKKTELTEGAIYNLAGQRVNSLQRGINIVNGKKVLVK